LELHVAFNYSAAGSIRCILMDGNATVVRFSDDLSRGPISPPQAAIRRKWLDEHLGYDNPDKTGDESTFWPKVLEKEVSRIAWVSRRSASEYCNFLEYLRRLGDLPTHIIDTTDAITDNGEFFRGTGSIPPNHILTGLLSTAHEMDMAAHSDSQDLWERLRAEDSALRVVDKNLNLSSVPLSFYDQKLLSLVTHDWQPMTRIAGAFLARESVDDLLLVSRLYALVDAQALVARQTDEHHPDVKLANT
jgi:Protein of unknown function/Domain of unknown function (DUF1835)